jgi:hypothetical protein
MSVQKELLYCTSSSKHIEAHDTASRTERFVSGHVEPRQFLIATTNARDSGKLRSNNNESLLSQKDKERKNSDKADNSWCVPPAGPSDSDYADDNINNEDIVKH